MVVSGSGSEPGQWGAGGRCLTGRTGQNSSKLFVCVHPGKRSDRFYLVDEAFHVDLSARAVDGQANQHLVQFLGKILSVPPSFLVIRRGSSSRYKEVLFPIAEDDLKARARAVVSV